MYRAELLPCGDCGSLMKVIPVHNAAGETVEVDVCAQCKGVFIEYFDGEPSELSRALTGPIPEEAKLEEKPEEVIKPINCPACRAPMTLMRYLDNGPEVSRCPGCMGLFATRPQLERLSRYVIRPETPPIRRAPSRGYSKRFEPRWG